MCLIDERITYVIAFRTVNPYIWYTYIFMYHPRASVSVRVRLPDRVRAIESEKEALFTWKIARELANWFSNRARITHRHHPITSGRARCM